jgi:hypothetical protein
MKLLIFEAHKTIKFDHIGPDLTYYIYHDNQLIDVDNLKAVTVKNCLNLYSKPKNLP